MKKPLIFAFAGALALAVSPVVSADTMKETVTEKTTTYKGVVSEMPDSQTIMLKTETGSPTRYTFNEKTTFVDESGAVVSRETIRNQPVTIHTVPGGSSVVSRVVVGPRTGGDTTIRKETHVEERRVQ
jgi:hypothetical protein